MELRRGGWDYSMTNVTKLTIFTDIQPVDLNKCTQDCCKPLVNFQSSGKVDSEDFFFFLPLSSLQRRDFLAVLTMPFSLMSLIYIVLIRNLLPSIFVSHILILFLNA